MNRRLYLRSLGGHSTLLTGFAVAVGAVIGYRFFPRIAITLVLAWILAIVGTSIMSIVENRRAQDNQPRELY